MKANQSVCIAVCVALDAVGVSAHAHYIARQLKMTATLPGGDLKTLLWIKDWDFAWQDSDYFQQLAPLPKGTRLDVEIHWDNSAENPRNPSTPPVRVTWGEESKDEMGSISLMALRRRNRSAQSWRKTSKGEKGNSRDRRCKPIRSWPGR